jgi:RNA polymerase sigma factor (sigma-70 family)
MTRDESINCGEGKQRDDSVIKEGIRKLRGGMDANAPELSEFNLELDILIHERAVKIFQWRGCPDPEGSAAELTESLIEKLLERKFMNYDENRLFWPWINTVIRNACRELPRRQIRRKELLWKHRYRLLPLTPFKQPDQAAALKEIIPLVQEAIKQLPKEQQEVIRLRVNEELSRSETAEQMGLEQLQTISNRIFQAKERLSESLDPDSVTDAA